MKTGSSIPHSGDYLRIFARTDMTDGALRVATALACHIAFERGYRGAPIGTAAFTMDELADTARVCVRTVRRALGELAELFGLSINRRHHERHIFRFEHISPADNEDRDTDHDEAPAKQDARGVTGHQSPVALYTRTKSNNGKDSMITIQAETGSVHQSGYAEIINEAKKGTAAEKTCAQLLWNGFNGLNQRNHHAHVPLSWLLAFIKKAPVGFKQTQKLEKTVKQARPSSRVCPVQKMARYADSRNRQFHASDLVRAIGQKAYDERVRALMERYGVNKFAAQLAVHGNAVKQREIQS